MTYYIDYEERTEKNILKRIYKRIFFKFYVINADNNKKVIYINKKYINKWAYRKIESYLKKNRYDDMHKNVVIAKQIQANEWKDITYTPPKKIIMNSMILEILKYIESIIGIDFRNENIDISVCNSDNKDLLIEIAKMCRCVNIITTKIGAMRRLESQIQKCDILFSISNNRRKALKKSKVFINLDFTNKILNDFEVNRNCIVINLNESIIELDNKFQGCIIDDISIDFNNRYEVISKDNYDTKQLYSSYLRALNHKEVTNTLKKDNCKIINLLGYRGYISKNELINNFTNSTIKLDKTRKMD